MGVLFGKQEIFRLRVYIRLFSSFYHALLASAMTGKGFRTRTANKTLLACRFAHA